jgi:hypothetical protein
VQNANFSVLNTTASGCLYLRFTVAQKNCDVTCKHAQHATDFDVQVNNCQQKRRKGGGDQGGCPGRRRGGGGRARGDGGSDARGVDRGMEGWWWCGGWRVEKM